jgi:hypothetical protein
MHLSRYNGVCDIDMVHRGPTEAAHGANTMPRTHGPKTWHRHGPTTAPRRSHDGRKWRQHAPTQPGTPRHDGCGHHIWRGMDVVWKARRARVWSKSGASQGESRKPRAKSGRGQEVRDGRVWSKSGTSQGEVNEVNNKWNKRSVDGPFTSPSQGEVN